jgi:hypothetical protein
VKIFHELATKEWRRSDKKFLCPNSLVGFEKVHGPDARPILEGKIFQKSTGFPPDFGLLRAKLKLGFP